jgi:hypothetical protein
MKNECEIVMIYSKPEVQEGLQTLVNFVLNK